LCTFDTIQVTIILFEQSEIKTVSTNLNYLSKSVSELKTLQVISQKVRLNISSSVRNALIEKV